MKKIAIILAIGASALAASSAFAQQNTLRIGYSSVAPHSDASAISGPLTPANSLSLEVKNQSTLFFSYARGLSDNLELELAMGIPPKHDVAIKIINPALPAGLQAYNGKIGAKVAQFAPTGFVNYKFGSKSSAFRPFVGAGINFTKFSPADSTADGDAINGGPTRLALKNSTGLALQLGASYQVNQAWSVQASFATARVKTTLTTNTLGIVRTADINFRPQVFTLAAGYSF